MQPPTVVIAIIARNAAHSLPYYLGALERLNYPKDRISVWWVVLLGPSGAFLRLYVNGISRSLWPSDPSPGASHRFRPGLPGLCERQC